MRVADSWPPNRADPAGVMLGGVPVETQMVPLIRVANTWHERLQRARDEQP
jgi:hypothetical protein